MISSSSQKQSQRIQENPKKINNNAEGRHAQIVNKRTKESPAKGSNSNRVTKDLTYNYKKTVTNPQRQKWNLVKEKTSQGSLSKPHNIDLKGGICSIGLASEYIACGSKDYVLIRPKS